MPEGTPNLGVQDLDLRLKWQGRAQLIHCRSHLLGVRPLLPEIVEHRQEQP